MSKVTIGMLLAVISGAVIGCDNFYQQNRVDRLDEMGSAHLSVASIAKFDDNYRKLLTAQFTLSPDDAVKAVLPDTLAYQDKVLDAMAIKAKVALPTVTSSQTTTTSQDAGKKPTVTSTGTITTASGDVSKISFESSPTSGSAKDLF